MKNKRFFLSIALILLGLVWIWVSRITIHSQNDSRINAPQEGFLAPDFDLITMTGEEISLSELQGKAVIINFWASWCPPCRAEMPDFQIASQEYDPSHLIILGVNQTHQDSINSVESFVLKHQLDFPILLDEHGIVGRTYQVHSLPSTFFIGADGVIKEIFIGGPLPLSLLRVEIDDLIKESINAPSN